MTKYEVYAIFTVYKKIGNFEANSQEDAIKIAKKSNEFRFVEDTAPVDHEDEILFEADTAE